MSAPCASREAELREKIVQIGRLIYERGWIAATDGNVSARLDAESILATPTGVSKGMMQPGDLIVVGRNGNKIRGVREQTTEIGMHLTIYELRPDVQAVVHAHPPIATGHAAAGRDLALALLPEVIVTLGRVPLAEYGLPGTPELTRPMRPLIPKHNAILMANHGAVAYGQDLDQAFFRMETMEHFARVSLVAELLGGPRVLPRAEVDKLIASRERYGIKTNVEPPPERPMAAEDVPRACSGPRGDFLVSREQLLDLLEEAMRRAASMQAL